MKWDMKMLFYFAAYNKLTFCSTTTTTTKWRGNYAFLRQNKYVGVHLISDPIFAHLIKTYMVICMMI